MKSLKSIDMGEDKWIERAHALARTQANYVWILLVTGLFYFSLSDKSGSVSQSQSSPEIPLLGFPLDTHLVVLTAPLVLSLLILAFSGAVRAFKRASDAALSNARNGNWAAEKLDIHPNAIDMVVYHTEDTPQWIVTIGYFLYPVYLSLFLIEAGWLWYVSFSWTSGIPGISLSIVSAVLLVCACWQVLVGWKRRFNLVRQGKHLKDDGQPDQSV